MRILHRGVKDAGGVAVAGAPAVGQQGPHDSSAGRLPLEETVRAPAQETPADSTHWSTRSLAKVVNVSPSSVGRIWREKHLKPHRVRTFKLSNDPKFAEKTDDIF